jgi:1,2-diacylglycerol 3-alpha-glucosyltransferase
MRILIAGSANYPAMNGQAMFTENLTEGLARQGHEVLSILPSEKGNAYQVTRNYVQMEAIQSYNLKYIIHSDVLVSLFSRKSIRQIYRTFRPEIVHIQDHFPASQDAVHVALEFGIPLIGTNHFMPENIAGYVPLVSKFKSTYTRLAWNWMLGLYNQLDVATAQSKASAALMRSQGLSIPVFPVSCGINLNRFHPDPCLDRRAFRKRYGLDPNRKMFLFVGRIDQEKRIDVLLRAMKILDRNDIQMVIAGQGVAEESLKAYGSELGLGERARFTGFIPAGDLPSLLNSADFFTMPSEAELLSIASLEAMACGKPVLLANAVALPELVTDGMNGYLFRPGDAADAARCMALLADQPEKWAQMSACSLARAQFHSLENTLKQYEDLYRKLIDGSFSNRRKAAEN